MKNAIEILISLRDQTRAGFDSVRGSVDSMTKDVGGLKDTFTDLGMEFAGGRLADAASAGFKKILGVVGSVTDAVFSLQGALAGLGAGYAAREMLGVSSAFEGFEGSLKTIQGSSEAAKASMSWIEDFTARTPYELEQVTEGFTRLSAYGMDAAKHMRTLGDTASAMNKPMMAAVEMMADAVTGEFERLKEFGVRARTEGDQVTFSWIQNGQQMSKTMEKTGKSIEEGLLGILGGRFSGAMDEFSGTWAGMMSNLKDSWTLFQKAIMDSGPFQYLKNELSGLLDKVNELKANGTLDVWAEKAGAAIVRLLEAMKTMGRWAAELIGWISSLSPATLAMGAAFGVAAIAFMKIFATVSKLVMAFSLLNAAMGGQAVTAIAAYSTRLTGMIATFQQMGAALATIRTAMLGMMGAFAAFGAGWAVGRWISDLKLFGDGTRSVGEEFQRLLKKMDLFGDHKGLEQQKEQIQDIIDKLAGFSDYKLPDGIADATNEELDEMSEKLRLARSYWTAILLEQENLRDAAVTKGETEDVAKAEEAIEAARERLSELNGEFGRLSKIEGGRTVSAQIAQLNDELAALTDKNAKNIETELNAYAAMKVEELRILRENMEAGTVAREEGEAKALDIAEKYATMGHEARARHVRESAEAESAIRLEILDKQRHAELENVKAKIDDETTLLNAIVRINAEYNKKIADEKRAMADKIRAEDQKIAQESLAMQAEMFDRQNAQAVAKIKLRFAEIETLEKQGVMSAESAAEEKTEIERKHLAEILDQKKAMFETAGRAYEMDSAEYQDAVQAKLDAEVALAEFEADQVKRAREATDARIADMKRETDQAAAEMKRREAEIALLEAQGEISAGEATKRRIALANEEAEARVAAAEEALRILAETYDKESKAYEDAVMEKVNAETALMQVQAEAAEASRNHAGENAEASEAVESYTEATGRASEAARSYTINLSESDNTLRQMGQTLQDYREDYEKMKTAFNPTVHNAMIDIWGAMTAQIEETRQKYRELDRAAADAGLSVNNFDKTLAEASADTADRINAWTDFTETLQGLKIAMDDLDGLGESGGLAEAEAAFRQASAGADELAQKIAAVNAEMGTGNLDEAQAMAEGVISSYRDIYEQAKNYLDSLKSEWDQYYSKVQEIQDKIAGLNRTADEAIREIRRKAMSEEELWADKRLEYEENYSAGVQAMREKDYETAETYFDKAMRLAEGFSEKNSELAISLIEKTRQAAEESLGTYARETESAMQSTEKAITQTTGVMDNLSASIGGTINKVVALKQSLASGGGFTDKNLNIDFTGTGSSRRPIMDKLSEIKGGVQGMVRDVRDASVNIDFSNVRRGLEAVTEATSGAIGRIMPGGQAGSGGAIPASRPAQQEKKSYWDDHKSPSEIDAARAEESRKKIAEYWEGVEKFQKETQEDYDRRQEEMKAKRLAFHKESQAQQEKERSLAAEIKERVREAVGGYKDLAENLATKAKQAVGGAGQNSAAYNEWLAKSTGGTGGDWGQVSFNLLGRDFEARMKKGVFEELKAVIRKEQLAGAN